MLYRFLRAIVRPLIKLFFRLKTTYEAPLPKEGAVILCGKHISAPDPVFLIATYGRDIHFMAKAELFLNPIIASLMSKLHVFPVRRGGGDINALKTSLKILGEGKVLGIMPEGHRVRGIENIELKTGAMNLAMHSGAVLVPFGLYTKDYTVKLFRRVYLRYGKPIALKKEDFKDGNKEALTELTEKLLKNEILRLSMPDYAAGEE